MALLRLFVCQPCERAGLKEKLLAARYAGIHHVLVPAENKPDIDEMDAEILEGLDVAYVESMGNVLEHALSGAPEDKS